MQGENKQSDHASSVVENTSACHHSPKWAAVIGDRLFPMPRRKIAARDILDQAGVGKEFLLVRDHGSPDDVIFQDPDEVDLGMGNVFRVIPRCEAGPQPDCTAPAKLAFV